MSFLEQTIIGGHMDFTEVHDPDLYDVFVTIAGSAYGGSELTPGDLDSYSAFQIRAVTSDGDRVDFTLDPDQARKLATYILDYLDSDDWTGSDASSEPDLSDDAGRS